MSHFLLDSSYGNEIVEDSEPEREMRRRARQHKTALPSRRHLYETYRSDLDESPVLELGNTGKDRTSSPIVIDISSPSSDEGESEAIAGPSNFIIPRALPLYRSETTRVIQGLLPCDGSPLREGSTQPTGLDHDRGDPLLPIANTGPKEDSLDSDDEQPIPLDLNKFAFKPSTMQCNSRPSLSRSSSSLLNAAKPVDSKYTKARPIANVTTLASQFTDTQLGTLLVCVCCEVKWTTRKGVTQKLAHIKACAKKHAFTDETVRALISQVLASVPPSEPNKDLNKKIESQTSKTYLEEVIDDTGKKKERRAKPVETVLKITDTRGDILNRARTVLDVNKGLCANPKSNSSLPKSVDARVDKNAQRTTLSDDDEPIDGTDSFPSTQVFAPSKFGATARSSTLFRLADQSDTNIDDDRDLSRSRIPTYAPSMFGTVPSSLVPSSSSNKRSADCDLTTMLSKHPARSEILSRLDQVTARANAYALPLSGNKINPVNDDMNAAEPSTTHIHTLPEGNSMPSQDFIYDSLRDDDSPDRDDAWLHYDPDISTTVASPLPLVSSKKPPALPPGERLMKMANLEVPKRRRRKAKTNEDAEDNPEWKEQLKASILNNEGLHLRILRYEPIHFNEFLKLMVDKATVSKRTALRAFLDEQAIHYYGADNRKRR